MNPQQLMICTGCASLPLAEGWLPHLEAAMAAYDILTPQQQAHFLAQIGHESGGLRWVTEIWGPTPVQARYEGRADLGNTQPGDGRRYCGRGLLQITGRANYARITARLGGPDFVDVPGALALPQWAAMSAADFWAERGLNQYADIGDVDAISDLINRGHRTRVIGDANGFPERLALTQAGLAALCG